MTSAMLPRRMPRSLDPDPRESLAGYLLNLSHRLGLPPNEVAVRIGMEAALTTVSINIGYTITLPEAVATSFGHAAGLSPAEVNNLTLARWDGLLFDTAAPAKAARTLHGSGWINTSTTRACPQCLAIGHPHAPDRTIWRAAWRTPWAVACTEHELLLEDTCNSCGHKFGESGNRSASLVPNPIQDVTHPAACRTRPARSKSLCGHRIDAQAASPAPALVLAVQARLDALLNAVRTEEVALGVPVAPSQYLRDLRAVAVLLQLADLRLPLVPLPAPYTTALREHLDSRAQRRAARSSDDRSDRTWTEAPAHTRTLAALLVQAAHILDLPTAADARDVLPPLVATASQRERLAWNRIRSAAQPSDGLFRYFAPRRAGAFSTHMLRTATPTRQEYRITSDHVPAYLDTVRYQRWFADFEPAAETNIRRAVPLATTQLINGGDLAAAAHRLGTPLTAAQAAVIRAGRACKRTGRDDEFRALIGSVAADLNSEVVNYGHRRRTLQGNWQIPDDDWHILREAMLLARVARQDTPWKERRTAVTVWVWSLVTSGDPALAPMIATRAPSGRRSTGGALAAHTTLVRRAHPTLVALVDNYATGLGRKIDDILPADEKDGATHRTQPRPSDAPRDDNRSCDQNSSAPRPAVHSANPPLAGTG